MGTGTVVCAFKTMVPVPVAYMALSGLLHKSLCRFSKRTTEPDPMVFLIFGVYLDSVTGNLEHSFYRIVEPHFYFYIIRTLSYNDYTPYLGLYFF